MSIKGTAAIVLQNLLLLLLAYCDSSVFGVHITDMGFCVAPFHSGPFLSRIHLAAFLGWIIVNAKPKRS